MIKLMGESTAHSKKNQPYRKFLLVAGLVLLLAAALAGAFYAHLILSHNFHVVSAGHAYRSGQMDGPTLTRVIQEDGIKSILNLRGHYDEGWYRAETNVSQQLGVQHYDLELDATVELKDSELDQLTTILNAAPKPLLIHCKNGADRTGLAGALYLYSVEGKPADEAAGELNFFSGHIPYLFWRKTVAMDNSFERYVKSHAPSQPTGAVARPENSPAMATGAKN
jgi:protein tyrosine/serine phosphatase